MTKKIALVTGGNRGIGFEVCRQLAKESYKIILAARDASKGEHKAEELRNEGLDVEFLALDVTDPSSIQYAFEYVQKKFGRLDALVNNAAVLLDKDAPLDKEAFEKTLETNVIGVYFLCQAFGPMMKKQGYGRIVNVSSGMGQLSEMKYAYPAYSISKSALNALTKQMADFFKDSNILVNSVCPGWVKTDMGGENAPRSIEEGASGIVWAATLPDGSPSGGFFRDRRPIAW